MSDAIEARELFDALTLADYKVLHGESGEEALQLVFEEMAKGQTPSLALIDIKLPGISGIGVLERVRGITALDSCPVIIVTAAETIHEVRKEALKAGAWGVAMRPLDPDRIVGTVRSLIRGQMPRSRTIIKDVHKAEYEYAVEDLQQKRRKQSSLDQ